MIVIVVIAVWVAAASAWSFLRSPDVTLQRWIRRGGYRPYVGFAHAEAAGVRIRSADVLLEGASRRMTRLRPILGGGLIAAIATALLLLDAPVPVAVALLVLLLLPNLAPISSLREAAAVARSAAARSGTAILRARAHLVFGWLALIAAILLAWTAARTQQDGGSLAIAGIALAASIALSWVTAATTLRGRRISASLASTHFGIEVDEKDTLFLRSFNDDSLMIRAINSYVGALGVFRGYLVRFEEATALFARNHGPLVAIGRPGEFLPELGASRTYVTDDEWQQAVEDTARRAGSVLLVAGVTDGLAWELNHLGDRGLLQKTLVLLLPVPESQAWRRLFRVLEQMDIRFEHSTTEDGQWLGVLLRTVTAIGVSASGKPVFYVSDRRDWLAYAATIMLGQAYIRGVQEPPLHGTIANLLDMGVQLEPQ